MNGKTMTALSIVTIGGAPVGYPPCPSDTLVGCPECGGVYRMAIRPVGFWLTPVGIVIRSGYTERCPHCDAVWAAGSVLRYEGMCNG